MPYISSGGKQKDSSNKEVNDVYHSGNVYANFVPIALWQDPQGAEAAVLSAINSPDYYIDQATTEQLEGESVNPGAVDSSQKKLIVAGVITQAAIDSGSAAGSNPANTDPSPGVLSTGTTSTSVTVSTSVDDTVLYVSSLTGTTYTVKSVTKQPGVVFPYDVATVAPQNGYTAQEVCENLSLLIINCFDKIKAQYPDAYLTNTFRKADPGTPTSQHPKGMACDIQYSKASKADYFTRAQWIKDNVSFDQFLLEYKTTGTKNPWHHISFNKAGNRAQVCTFMNNKNCKGPGVTGLYDLSNT